MSELTITDSNFENEVLKAGTPVLVDFWAPWCGPCRAMGPVIEAIAEEFAGKAKVGKVNVDEEQEYASKYGIMSIPTIMIFKDGEVVEHSVGVQQKADLVAKLNKHIA